MDTATTQDSSADGDVAEATTPDSEVVDSSDSEVTEVADSDVTDSDAEETPETINPGAFGAACNTNIDCDSGYCVEGPSGYVCTRSCDTTCPTGYDCKSVAGGTDVTFLCLPRLKRLCAPCAEDFQCPGGACLLTDGEGRCAYPCLEANECPTGFACEPDPKDAVAGNFCQPTTGSCTCYADVDGGQRSCTNENAIGTCRGVATCDTATGWSACSAKTAAPETCNGADDDCDGVWDDGLEDAGASCQNAVPGVGACTGTQVCTGSAGWLCQGPLPVLETCNGLDDDCDTATDEDFKDVSGHFTLATHCGRCGNDCTTRFANGVGVCGGTPSQPSCVLDHCDNGFVRLGANQCVPPIDVTCQRCATSEDCYGGTCAPIEGQNVCLMPCATGTNACAPGFGCQAGLCAPTSGSCACTPNLEGAKRTCTEGNALGTCFGLETCTVTGGNASWSACSAAAPVPEVCNGGDDDCNGANDDALPNGAACFNEVANIGKCTGQRLCNGTNGWTCVGPIPRVESCNGQDDDCDGRTDEDFTDAAGHFTTDTNCGGCGIDCHGRIVHGTGRCGGTADVPVCIVSSCDNGYIALNDFECAVPPDLGCRTCTSDTECKGGTCTTIDSESVCVSPCGQDGVTCPQGYTCELLGGAKRCMPASGSCSCSVAIEGTQRTCYASNTFGTCFGLETCDLPAGWSGCSAPVPGNEVCNGRDDDCNGTADDGLLPPSQPCVKTVGSDTCRGAWHCAANGAGATDWVCDAKTPTSESCDGFDNDCDGLTDETYKDASGGYVDQQNCGACGVSCDNAIPNATAQCSGAGVSPRCEVKTCALGYYKAGPLTCLPVADNTCTPCSTDANCATPGDRCLALDGGHFCGRDCAAGNVHGTAAGACDAGYSCRDFSATLGAGVRQCVPRSNSCTCLAGDSGKSRTCTNANDNGTCFGTETCTPAVGWSACSARTPAGETCNTVDDDCNSAVDDVSGRGETCTIVNGFGQCPGTRDCHGSASLTCVGQTPAAETCNHVDDDCNGQTDEAFPVYQSCSKGQGSCQRYGFNDCTGDGSGVACNAVAGQPTTELCNGQDDDCDGQPDNNLVAPVCPKQLGVCAGAVKVCAGGAGFLACSAGNYGTNYEADETKCDGLDNDCDGQTDEVDLDGDHHIALACGGDDCDDTDRLSYPGATEICGDAADNDCNGTPDDRDADGDHFISVACGGDDCNDNAALANPGKIEFCGDGLDNDCDGSIDNRDTDHDSFIDVACGGTDCRDDKPTVYPGRPEACDALDNDCNGQTDDKDIDHDGFRDVACGGNDCDDDKPLVNIAAVEICGNAVDEDCSGAASDKDVDKDGQVDTACTGGTDCDDADPQVRNGAPELWDTKDDNCNGTIDEGVVPVGAVITTEVMRDPNAVSDTDGEYFEVTNVSDYPVNMKGWNLHDGSTPGTWVEHFTVAGPLLLTPGQTKVFCRNAAATDNGGAPCDYEFGGGMQLSNSSADNIVLESGTTEIDRLPMPAGSTTAKAWNLRPASYRSTLNDTAGNWCDTPAGFALSGGDLGTPSFVNPSCTTNEPGVVLVVPSNGVDDGGDSVTVFGSRFAAGASVTIGGNACTTVVVISANVLVCKTPAHAAGAVAVTATVGGATSLSLANGFTFTGEGTGAFDLAVLDTTTTLTLSVNQVSPIIAAHAHATTLTEAAGAPTGVLAQVGYGPAGTDPHTAPNWRWLPAVWTAQQGTSDAFGRSLVIGTAGTYSYTFRFSSDAGVNWLYGDKAPGTSDGFSAANLGSVTVTP